MGQQGTGRRDDSVAAMNLTVLRWRGTGYVYFFFGGRAIGSSQFGGFRVDHHGLNAIGLVKILYRAVAGQRGRFFHELGPDRRGGGASGQPDIAVVIKSDPDYGDQIRRESGKPAIARSSGLSSRRKREPSGPHRCSGAFVQYVLHQARDQVSDP